MNRMLSAAGKEVLLKSVIMAMSTYTMSCLVLPKKLCKRLNAHMARFWYGSKGEETKMQLINWKRITQTKELGGLGFRDLYHFNAAMLAKQLWRILTCHNLLLSKVLKSRYFEKSLVLQATPPKTASWIWRSKMSAKFVLPHGLRNIVGDGCTIDISEDKWVAGNPSGKVTTKQPDNCNVNKDNRIN